MWPLAVKASVPRFIAALIAIGFVIAAIQLAADKYEPSSKATLVSPDENYPLESSCGLTQQEVALGILHDPIRVDAESIRKAGELGRRQQNVSRIRPYNPRTVDDHRQWYESFEKSGVDAWSLPRADSLRDESGSEPDLAAAVAKADFIVLAESRYVHFDQISVVNFGVEGVLKSPLGGARPRELNVNVGGGPVPTFGYERANLDYVQSAPITLLKPGERVILFLEKDSDLPGGYDIQGFSGFYALDDNRIRPLPRNAFCREVDRLPLLTFLGLVRDYEQP